MAFLSSASNAIFVDKCQNLRNLTVTMNVTEDLVTVGATGFSLQLNSYPQTSSQAQGQTLNWFQYMLIVGGPIPNFIGWEVQYWSIGAQAFAPGQPWPPGYVPNPPNSTPWLPALTQDFVVQGFAPTPSNQILAGSVVQIKLTTNSAGNVTSATFNYTDSSGSLSTASFTFPAGAIFPIYGFQVNLVGPGGRQGTTFISGAGTLTYSVSPGTLSQQTSSTSCGGPQPGTGEFSNAVYGAFKPASGATIEQSFRTAPLSMAFKFDKSTFGEDEVKQNPTWGSAFWLAVSGFSNTALGFNSPSNLKKAHPLPRPHVFAAINQALNPTLTAAQVATISANLPSVNIFGPPPVSAIDDTLALNFQTFLYPYTIYFPFLSAFDALKAHQTAIITLTANLTVLVPDGKGTTGYPVACQANIELAKGEEPYFVNLNPSAPASYPSWLSFDLRLFKVTPHQKHKMFGVPNPTSADGAIGYVRQILDHLNEPSLIKNGDTFDSALTQNEESSAIEFFPVNDESVLTLNFAVARLRIKSSIKTTIGPVRVFFRLFNAASTVSDFTEVGTGAGTYRWGTNGTPGHKIPLLGVQADILGFPAEYVTVPCFATERVNLKSPADMNTQTDPPNARTIVTEAGKETEVYFGCWLDVNVTKRFLTPVPPFSPSQWDGPWPGTESLNGVVAAAPHQCLVAEIRFDDTPIPDGATAATSDKLARRNIAWLGVQP
jgi:hypothetical protein